MSKYLLSQKQKDAFKAVMNAIKVTAPKKEKRKVGENSYTGYEHTVFVARSHYDKMADRIFETKNANFSKRWKRSWNSIPTIFEIQDMAKKEYQNKIDSIQKRVFAKKEDILKEKNSINSKYAKVFYKELEKAKKSSKQTKNVKDLLAVQSLFEKKVVSFVNSLYKSNLHEWEKKNKDDTINTIKNNIEKMFNLKNDTLTVELSHFVNEDLDYRKEVLDMRGSAVIQYFNSFRWCADKKERLALEKKAMAEKIEDNRWYKKYKRIHDNIMSKIDGDFASLGLIYTDVNECDIYEPQRGDDIHTMNMLTDKFGNVKISWDDASNDCWSYIPKGYELSTRLKIDFRLMFSTNKTKSLITDTRKLKTLEKELENLNKEISKIKNKKDLV